MIATGLPPAGVDELSVVIADDAPLIREAIAAVLTGAGVAVAAQVGDPGALIAAVARHRPTVVVVDVRMPPTFRLEGLQAALALRSRYPDLGILLLSQSVQPRYLQRLIATGAARTGYLLKERAAGIGSFVEAVRTVAGGGCTFDPEVVAALVTTSRQASALDRLSPRERQVLELMATGRSNAAIAAALRLGPKTVESHVRRILQQLDVRDEPDVNRRVRAVLAYLQARDVADPG